MHCAHCENHVPYRTWFQFRFDGGYRCVRCRRVFYIGGREARSRMLPISLLMIGGFVAGLVFLLRFELMSAWTVVLYLVAFAPISLAAFHFGLVDALTMRSLPPELIWRRRCTNCALLILSAAQLASFLSRPYVPTDDWSHYIFIAGSLVGLLFLVAGFAHPPRVH